MTEKTAVWRQLRDNFVRFWQLNHRKIPLCSGDMLDRI